MKMDFHFILVEPALPENIGAAARAMKTMGFHLLRLVNPAGHLCERARWVAHGSNDILEQAAVFSDFDSAIEDIDLLIGTTVRKRGFKRNYYHVNELISVIKNKTDFIKSVGLVFGPEKSGLTNDQLKRCDIVSTIPMKNRFPSLNLAQSVMVYAFGLSNLNLEKQNEEADQARAERFLVLKNKVSRLLETFEITKDLNVYHRLMERLAALSGEDISLIHFICEKINKFLEKENNGSTS